VTIYEQLHMGYEYN